MYYSSVICTDPYLWLSQQPGCPVALLPCCLGALLPWCLGPRRRQGRRNLFTAPRQLTSNPCIPLRSSAGQQILLVGAQRCGSSRAEKKWARQAGDHCEPVPGKRVTLCFFMGGRIVAQPTTWLSTNPCGGPANTAQVLHTGNYTVLLRMYQVSC